MSEPQPTPQKIVRMSDLTHAIPGTPFDSFPRFDPSHFSMDGLLTFTSGPLSQERVTILSALFTCHDSTRAFERMNPFYRGDEEKYKERLYDVATTELGQQLIAYLWKEVID